MFVSLSLVLSRLQFKPELDDEEVSSAPISQLNAFVIKMAGRASTPTKNSSLIAMIAIEISKNKLWGWAFVGTGSVFFAGFFMAAVFSKLLRPSANPIISALQNDWYYCFLVPLTLPILLVAVYFHWLSMKIFKHA